MFRLTTQTVKCYACNVLLQLCYIQDSIAVTTSATLRVETHSAYLFLRPNLLFHSRSGLFKFYYDYTPTKSTTKLHYDAIRTNSLDGGLLCCLRLQCQPITGFYILVTSRVCFHPAGHVRKCNAIASMLPLRHNK